MAALVAVGGGWRWRKVAGGVVECGGCLLLLHESQSGFLQNHMEKPKTALIRRVHHNLRFLGA